MITVSNLCKKFRLYHGPKDMLKEIIFRRKQSRQFTALKDVSFEVLNGETLGIIGQNGAGKSTLLKILTGVLLPDEGSIAVNGKITGLLELGTGFNTEMTGVQNIYMNGLLLDMTRAEMDSKLDKIVEFTELGDFINDPIKTYSSGMIMRLAFSIAIHADPKCFVVDEALSVGDAHFQQKCMNRIKSFRDNGGSIVFVSHDLNAIKMLCDKAVLLDHGVILERGDPEMVVNQYNFLIAKLNDREGKITILDKEQQGYGTFEAKITGVTFVGENSGSAVIISGETAVISVDIKAYTDINNVTVGILIRDKYGQDIFGTNTYHHKLELNLQRDRAYKCVFKIRVDIGPGKYIISSALHTKDTHLENCFHWIDNAASFEIAGTRGNFCIGLCKLYPEIEVKSYDMPQG